MKEIRDLPNRNWGIELEFKTAIPVATVVKSLSNNLITSDFKHGVIKSGYCHDGPANELWKVKPDRSCGLEITSPVLNGWNGLQELMVVMDTMAEKAINFNRPIVDSSCGIHIHVDAKDYSCSDIKKILLAMKFYEPIFFAMNPPSRFKNVYCKAIYFKLQQVLLTENKDKLHDVLFGYGNAGDRRVGFNITPWWTRGSLEFRYFSGTFSFPKAAANIMLCVIMVEVCKLKESVNLLKAKDSKKEQLDWTFDQIWSKTKEVGIDKLTEKLFRDFLMIRGGSCPPLNEMMKSIKTRINFFQSIGAY